MPGGLCGTEVQFALEAERGDAVFWFVMCHAAQNHDGSGVWVLSKTLPAVCEMTQPKPPQSQRLKGVVCDTHRLRRAPKNYIIS